MFHKSQNWWDRVTFVPGLRIWSGDSGLCQDRQWSLGKLSIVKTELFILKQSHDSYLTFSCRYRAMIPSMSSKRSLKPGPNPINLIFKSKLYLDLFEGYWIVIILTSQTLIIASLTSHDPSDNWSAIMMEWWIKSNYYTVPFRIDPKLICIWLNCITTPVYLRTCEKSVQYSQFRVYRLDEYCTQYHGSAVSNNTQLR